MPPGLLSLDKGEYREGLDDTSGSATALAAASSVPEITPTQARCLLGRRCGMVW